MFAVGKRAIKDFIHDDMNTYAGALTFRILLAIFPFLIFMLTLLDVLGLTNFFNWLLDQAQKAFPSDLYSQFEMIVQQVRGGANGGLLSFGLILALWAASGGVRAAMNALNAAYDVEESRPIWKKYPLSIVYTVGLAALLIAAVALMLLGPQTMEWLAGQIGLGDVFVTIWAWLRIPAAILIMMLAVALVYYFFPNVDQPFQIVSPGSVVAVLTWVVATIGFSFYISNFANYNATYGSLAGVVVLLLYFFISSAVLLFGAEINGVIYKAEHGTEDDNVEDSAVQEARQETTTA
ncbi:MAG TPA: YihY/virulence factor BrkB family protein [Thermomicrobiales bacterium]|nr:YihY/virulence factor BrkB family protein [Thermomicrobiales bacterium]